SQPIPLFAALSAPLSLSPSPYTTLFRSSPMTGKNPRTAPLANTTPSPPKGKPRSKPSKPTGKSSPSLFIPSSNPMVSKILHINRSEEHTSELQSRENLVCRLLLEKKKEQ